VSNDPRKKRLVESLMNFSHQAAVIRAAALGARVDVQPGGHTDHLLKALHDHADVLENGLRRFIAEQIEGVGYEDPPLERFIQRPATH
jgi:hypothetical protein